MISSPHRVSNRVLVGLDEHTSAGEELLDVLQRCFGEDCCVLSTQHVGDQLDEETPDVLVLVNDEATQAHLEILRRLQDQPAPVEAILIVEHLPADVAMNIMPIPGVTCRPASEEADRLLDAICSAGRRSQIRRSLEQTQLHVGEWDRQLRQLAEITAADAGKTQLQAKQYTGLMFGNLARILQDMRALTEGLAGWDVGGSVCHLFRCPSRKRLLSSVREAVDALERTKRSFKSKELAELRRNLEATLQAEQELD